MFNNITIKMKLLFSFTLIALLMIFSSTTSVFDISSSSSGFNDYRKNVATNLKYIKIEDNILLLNNDVKTYLSNPSNKVSQNFDKHYKDIESLVNDVLKNSSDNTIKADISNIQDSLKEYKSNFNLIVELMKKRDDIYFNNLSKNGKAAVELLNSITLTSELNEKLEISMITSYAVKYMLNARLYTMKFLASRSKEDVKKITREFEFLTDQLSDLSDELEDEGRITKLKEANTLIPVYIAGVENIVKIIEKSNGVIQDTDTLSNKITEMIGKIKKRSEKEKNQLGNEVNSLNDGIKNKTIIIGLIILILVISFSITISRGINKALESLNNGILSLMENNDVSSRVEVISKDEIGKIAENFNNYLQSIEDGLNEDQKVIDDVKRAVFQVKEGRLNEEVNIRSKNKKLNELTILFNEMLQELNNKISEDIGKIEKALETYSKLDFTHRIENPKAKLEMGLNHLADTINEMLVENKTNGLTIEETSNRLLENVEAVSKSSNEAASSIEETAGALEEITSTIVNNTQNIQKMAAFANDLTISTKSGKTLAQKTTSSMDQINDEVNAINDAITVIDQIAFQTNILSLNAAVEAATAGEAGKGFAVVAQEVRNLANRSAQAANEIKKIVESATSKANEGKQVSNEMINGYELLANNITETLELINEVEGAFKEQKDGIEQINNSVNVLDSQTQNNAEIANRTKEIANVSQSIATAVLESANAKEFIGKDEVAKRKQTIDLDYKGDEKRHIENSVKKTINIKEQSPKPRNKFSDETKDDEWESF